MKCSGTSESGAATLGRRTALATVASGLLGSVTGCLTEPSFPDADVLAGPDGRLAFEPAAMTVAPGETVRWGFPTAGHNVSGRPADADPVTVPADAAPFASYGPEQTPQRHLVPRGGTYEHTFDVPGEYVYACIPHVDRGMVGVVRVE
ncbi:MAG: plastocyanin/azurin family copper-binding protein [Haloglomus sp.]